MCWRKIASVVRGRGESHVKPAQIVAQSRAVDVRRTMPLTRGAEKFFEDFPARRWMETFEPLRCRIPEDHGQENTGGGTHSESCLTK